MQRKKGAPEPPVDSQKEQGENNPHDAEITNLLPSTKSMSGADLTMGSTSKNLNDVILNTPTNDNTMQDDQIV